MKQIYLALLAVIFCLPLAQMKFKIFREEPLNGVEDPVSLPELKINALLDRSFQQGMEKWFSRKFGLRAFYVRCNNQIYYSLFGQTPPSSTIEVGKNRQLFEKAYIYHYLSIIPPATHEFLKKYAADIRQAQEKLAAQGKTFVLLISPSKAAFYSEYIPGYYHSKRRTQNDNYEVWVSLLKEEGINYIDGPKIIREAQKTEENISLFPRGGTHWNQLGAYYVLRELLELIQDKSGKNMVPLVLKERKIHRRPINSDRDLAMLLNLTRPPIRYAVPELSFEKPEKARYYRPRILLNGGSFTWLPITILNACDYFHTIDIFYYYSSHYRYDRHGDHQEIGKVDPEHWPVDIMDKDIVILEMNESAIAGTEFVEDLIKNLKK